MAANQDNHPKAYAYHYQRQIPAPSSTILALSPTALQNLLCKNTRGSMLVRRALAAQAAEKHTKSVRVVYPVSSDSEESPDTDESESEEESTTGKISVKILRSNFEKEDIIPKYNKRRSSSLSPKAKAALEDLRAKKTKGQQLPRFPSPPPYDGVLINMAQ
jgi:hypothetical protein